MKYFCPVCNQAVASVCGDDGQPFLVYHSYNNTYCDGSGLPARIGKNITDNRLHMISWAKHQYPFLYSNRIANIIDGMLKELDDKNARASLFSVAEKRVLDFIAGKSDPTICYNRDEDYFSVWVNGHNFEFYLDKYGRLEEK